MTDETKGVKLRNEVYPMLPDSDGATDYNPHPDGRPWRKACSECYFRTCDPQGAGRILQSVMRTPLEGTVFYCLHRQDDGCERICACFAAIQETAGRSALAAYERGQDSHGE